MEWSHTLIYARIACYTESLCWIKQVSHCFRRLWMPALTKIFGSMWNDFQWLHVPHCIFKRPENIKFERLQIGTVWKTISLEEFMTHPMLVLSCLSLQKHFCTAAKLTIPTSPDTQRHLQQMFERFASLNTIAVFHFHIWISLINGKRILILYQKHALKFNKSNNNKSFYGIITSGF